NGQQDGGGHTDGSGWGQQADGDGGATHQHHRSNQHTLAAEFVPEVTKQDPTQWAGNVPNRQYGEGQKQSNAWIKVDEEHLAEHNGGRSREQDEVVKLNH